MAEGQDEGFLWDHAGENLENDPLIECYRTGYSTFYSPTGRQKEESKLPIEQAERVLANLEQAHFVVKTYVDKLKLTDSSTHHPPNNRNQSCCRRCLRKFQMILEKLTNYIIIISLVLQLIDIVVLTIIDFIPKSDKRTVLILGATLMIILQVANLLLVIYASIKLANQVYHRSVNSYLLVQGYCATLLLFAGVYTATFRLDVMGWKFITEDVIQNPILLAVSYAKFLFFSVSTGTLCGSSNVLPKAWYNCILVSVQMLLSYTYFASILGQAIMMKTFASSIPPKRDNSTFQRTRSRRGSTQSDRSQNLSIPQSNMQVSS